MLRLLPLLLLALLVAASDPSPFAPSRIETASGKKMYGDLLFEAADCGECHVDQARLWRGSAHSRSHHDAIYLAFAETARKEGGEAFYRFCSG